MEINSTLGTIVSQASRNTRFDLQHGNRHIRMFPIRKAALPFQHRTYTPPGQDGPPAGYEPICQWRHRNAHNRGTARLDNTNIVMGSSEGFNRPSFRFRSPQDRDGVINRYGWKTLHVLYKRTPIAVVGNAGKIRIIQPAAVGQRQSIRAIAWRYNVLMDFFHYKDTEGGDIIFPPMVFYMERGKLVVQINHDSFSDGSPHPPGCSWYASQTKIEVCSGDVIDTNTWKYYSRPMERLAPMPDITTGEGNYPISQGVLTGFLREPQSTILRARVRSEINRILPDEVTDRQRLDDFLEQERLLIRTNPNEPDQFVISRLPEFLPDPPVPA